MNLEPDKDSHIEVNNGSSVVWYYIDSDNEA